jgi:hypothetical protein
MPAGAEPQIPEFKPQFATWICGNALREIIESLEVSLAEVYGVCCLVAQSTGAALPSQQQIESFER